MIIKASKKNIAKICLALGAGGAAGFLNGFLGAGGGIIYMYLLRYLNPDKSDRAQRDNFASVVAAVLPLSVISAIIYSAKGTADPGLIGRYIIPAAAGGVLGALITDKVNTAFLKGLFSAVMIIAGINMLL